MSSFALFLLQESLQDGPDPALIQHILMMIIPFIMIIMLISIAIVMVPCWFILKKAGFSPWLALLCIMPSLGTLVLLYILAFAEWKTLPPPQAQLPPQPPYPPYPPVPPQA
jgi:hypothetical protein